VDPSGKFAELGPRLQRFWLPSGDKVPADTADDDGILRSRLIPFGLLVLDEWVRVVDLVTGEVLPTPKESELRRLQAEREAREALARAWEADLLTERAQEQADQARQQTRVAQEQADQARQQARVAEERSAGLEAELARLRRLLDER